MAKNPPVTAGGARGMGSVPASGRSPRVGRGTPLRFPCLDNSWAEESGVCVCVCSVCVSAVCVYCKKMTHVSYVILPEESATRVCVYCKKMTHVSYIILPEESATRVCVCNVKR